ncbi:hypothetical protein chiPu_0024291, partial [Chiloscyllium punctatum]|nr:hypothetical protein [Chiloscyllium punctatum]
PRQQRAGPLPHHSQRDFVRRGLRIGAGQGEHRGRRGEPGQQRPLGRQRGFRVARGRLRRKA